MKSLALLIPLTLSACAIMPDTVRTEFEHISHATQHRPFTDTPTKYGANMANLVLHWDLPKRFSIELAEGVDLDKHYPSSNGYPQSYGEILGPREEFSGRIAYSFKVPK
jgi:hypothetical protein